MNKEKELKLFNHGIFQEYIQSKLEYLTIQMSKESDPYKKWNFQEQIKLCEEFFNAYKDSVNSQLK